MKLIKMLGTTLLGCAALMSVGVSAQMPASCSWEITNTIFTPQQQTTYQRCKDNNSGAKTITAVHGLPIEHWYLPHHLPVLQHAPLV